MNELPRKIIHIDMDAFYASVEQRDFPALRGQPVIVGGSPDSRGVVAACSYEARRFGIRSAMPSVTARRLCPHAVFVKPRFDVYREASGRIQRVFRDFTDRVEPLALDEAFLDVSSSERWQGSATLLAREIKSRIAMLTGLTASAGVSYNKFLAKIASDMDKPDGLFVITPEQGERFVEGLPIGRFFGVGKATEAKMHGLGIYTGADIRGWSREALIERFGKAGGFYYEIARGIDNRPVNPVRVRKSISKETTFAEDLHDREAMLEILKDLAGQVSGELRGRQLLARTLVVKVKYADFRQVTRSLSLARPVAELAGLEREIGELLARTDAGRRPVRLLGVGVSGLSAAAEQPGRQPQISLL